MEPAPHHASCVALGDFGVLITGESGSGKSALALQLMAFGATLVADDNVVLSKSENSVIASCPRTIRGLIEVRGVGVLDADTLDQVPVCLVVDMDVAENDRIPPRREVTLLGCEIPLLHGANTIHLAPAIMQWMRAGRSDR